MKSGWTLLDFTGEIHQISGVKSGGFHEILGHSPHPAFIKLKSFCWNTCFYNFGWISQVKSGWNPPDFRVKSTRFLGWNPLPCIHQTEEFFAKTLAFIILGGFHRSNLGWNLPDFMGEIHWISRVKSPTLHSSNWRVFAETLAFIILGGFHRWYLGEIHWISQVKSARFQGEI